LSNKGKAKKRKREKRDETDDERFLHLLTKEEKNRKSKKGGKRGGGKGAWQNAKLDGLVNFLENRENRLVRGENKKRERKRGGQTEKCINSPPRFISCPPCSSPLYESRRKKGKKGGGGGEKEKERERKGGEINPYRVS